MLVFLDVLLEISFKSYFRSLSSGTQFISHPKSLAYVNSARYVGLQAIISFCSIPKYLPVALRASFDQPVTNTMSGDTPSVFSIIASSSATRE